MQKKNTNEIKVGVVSTIGLLLLIFVFIYTKNFDFNSNKTKVLFRFDNALGLNEGSPIFISGVKKGSVNKI